MKPYPIMLDLFNRLAVVAGGGAVGRRRVERLLAAGARVRVVDPAAGDWPTSVEHVAEPYRAEHLTGAAVVLACTSDPAVNARIAADAKAAGILVNVASDPAAGDFTVPAVGRTEAVTIAVATDAGIPALAASLRDACVASVGHDVDAFAQALAEIRAELKPRYSESKRGEIMRRLCGPEGRDAFAEGGAAALRAAT